MDKCGKCVEVWDEITYPSSNFNGRTVDIWEWTSNFIPHFIMDVITYSRWEFVSELDPSIAMHLTYVAM